MEEDEWERWRYFDGSAFCEIAGVFFGCLLAEVLLEQCPDFRVRRLGSELSRITVSFSARWFNKCAVGRNPERGSVRWYLRHCLGKLDMELERELSTHVEAPRTSSRRQRVEMPQLDFGASVS